MSVRIAIIGDLNPSYPSHQELEAARAVLGPDVETVWIGTTDPRIDRLAEMGVDGVWLAPGSPYADDAAALRAIRWAREHGIPFLGTCGGLPRSSPAHSHLGESSFARTRFTARSVR